MTDKAKLSAKEKTFVESYCGVAKFNGSEAARIAGYAPQSANVTASKLLTKPSIQEAISNFMTKATEKALCTTEDVVRGLLLEAKLNEEGASHSARVSAWRALSDYTGGFDVNKKKIDHSSTDGTMTPVANMTDEQLLKYLNE